MRKLNSLLVLAAMALLITTTTYAQVSLDKGVLFGLNFATFGGKDATNPTPENKTGLAIGGFVSFKVADMISIEPQLLYMQKGATAKVSQGGTTADITGSYNYLEVPVLAKFNIPLAGNVAFKPNIYAGPAFALRIGTPNLNTKTNTQTTDQDIQNTTSTDFGLVFGIGARIPGVVLKGILIDVRYTLGLSSVDNSVAKAEVKNRVFSILLGVAI
ncbi:MAG: PorT family protein [Ignavibacteriales bacterium]|nr:PorT family protein [Ignavibacteriales bacterium]